MYLKRLHNSLVTRKKFTLKMNKNRVSFKDPKLTLKLPLNHFISGAFKHHHFKERLMNCQTESYDTADMKGTRNFSTDVTAFLLYSHYSRSNIRTQTKKQSHFLLLELFQGAHLKAGRKMVLQRPAQSSCGSFIHSAQSV